MATGGGDPATAAIATVNVKLPPFWPADPEVWFAQVEAHFATKKLTSQKTRFDYVIASLSPEIATEVRDLILKPPEINPYDTLKKQLIKRTAPPEQRRLQQLFSSEELGDRKPTQLLRQMQQLLGDRAGTLDSTFLKQLFLQRLPANIRTVLATAPTSTTLDELAELADRIAEVATPTIATVTSNQPASELEQLRAEISKLQVAIQSLTKDRRSRSPSRGPRLRSPGPPTSADTICWYHRRFGEAATKCTPPCSMAKQENYQASH